ncbi:dolichyl-phosphate-mannose-protein mannosyltransferase [Amycolatopsis echigonensis]|uniref:Dolichyl-phosphate-mannose-protein mannosyltransferase n=1 Tax=Amycolatopsis echigonensis TaxID=2576905 RepID=A0A2N3X1H1_9PSEU|nr:glycosyltransferase family 39 protein [Amycolatopsis niigatensis]PKV99973.1 dolichyl-phosphate-mannose-protein mannosyltransferase [Amycolatopsis niigatensis]
MTAVAVPRSTLPRFAARPVAAVAVVQIAVLTALSGRYGFHRDELYFIAAGNRPAWGYVDQPPITPLLARAATTLFGDTPSGLRVVATLCGAATTVLVALVAREFGGDRRAQFAAAAATALSGYVLVVSHMLSTNSVDMVMWTAIGLLGLRLLRTGDRRWWLAIGAAAGVGAENKWLVLVLLAALGIALLGTGPRAVFASGWTIAGAAVAVVLMLPQLFWQIRHGFPMLTVAGGISADDGTKNRLLFVPMQLVYLSPVLVPVWISGLVRLWRAPELRWARAFALSYPVACLMLLLVGGKPYYAVPLLLILLAAGTDPALRWLSQGGTRRRGGAWILAAAGAVISVVIGLPVLPVAALRGPVLAFNKDQGEQVGWPELASTVARAWQRIPPDQRATAVLLTGNYGQAGALERFGPALGLPRPYSNHMSYADWGPPPDTMTGPVLFVGKLRPAILAAFGDCQRIAVNDNGAGLPNDEQGTAISLCSPSSEPWSRIWPRLRTFY